MSELTPKANALLVEYQNYIDEGYEAVEEEWVAFGQKAVSALYEAERVIAQLEAELAEAQRRIEEYEEALLIDGDALLKNTP